MNDINNTWDSWFPQPNDPVADFTAKSNNFLSSLQADDTLDPITKEFLAIVVVWMGLILSRLPQEGV